MRLSPWSTVWSATVRAHNLNKYEMRSRRSRIENADGVGSDTDGPTGYRFRLGQDQSVKDLSTGQGISFQVVDASGRAYFTTEPLLGSISVKGLTQE
jgi:hypothetical protein